MNSTYVEVCLLVHDRHKSGTEFVLFLSFVMVTNSCMTPVIVLYGSWTSK